jgi:predicted N-acyltransferase
VQLRTLDSIDAIDPAAWNACANPGGSTAFDPFLSHAFFAALERSGSAVERTGWRPLHLVLEDAGTVLGVLPLYLKSHSRGEYVFDQAWADAWHRAGGRYYPKLQSCVPFTPVTGRRLLVAARSDSDSLAATLAAGAIELAQRLGVSSLHVTFPTEPEWRLLAGQRFLGRIDQQFHWRNRGYASFDGFLAALSSKKRKNLRRERREALANGITVEWVTGSDLREHHWDAFFDLYMDTGGRKWGTPYLTRSFFSLVSAGLAEHTLLILCRRAGRYVAGALNFIGSNTLFGRNWGCIEDHPFLHFETCYYQAIDFAIARGLDTVEAGAQGGHKLIRGYEPTTTYSAHWIADAGFRRAIDRYLVDERRQVLAEGAWVAEHLPFRRDAERAAP